MNKLPSLLILAVLLSGCAINAMDVSPRQSYRPPGSKELWDISGSMHSNYDRLTGVTLRQLAVSINETPVINGNLSAMATGELTGRYKDHKVNSICTSEVKTESWMDVRCTILIDNERAATLTF